MHQPLPRGLFGWSPGATERALHSLEESLTAARAAREAELSVLRQQLDSELTALRELEAAVATRQHRQRAHLQRLEALGRAVEQRVLAARRPWEEEEAQQAARLARLETALGELYRLSDSLRQELMHALHRAEAAVTAIRAGGPGPGGEGTAPTQPAVPRVDASRESTGR
jgi:DNA repair exonuclease SbcCD ATPase subunit